MAPAAGTPQPRAAEPSMVIGTGAPGCTTAGGISPGVPSAAAGISAGTSVTGPTAAGVAGAAAGSTANASVSCSSVSSPGVASAAAGSSVPGSTAAGVSGPGVAGAAAGSRVPGPTAAGVAGAAAGPGVSGSTAVSAGMSGVLGAAAAAGVGGSAAASSGPLTLSAVDAKDLGDGFVAFPETARPPTNQSPGFRWTGVPAEAKSVALVFRDVSSAVPPVKWVLWNMPPDRSEVPANVSGSSAMPTMVPGASQLGSLGNQGYAGPCCVGNEYEWILYALDVAELPDTERMSTAQINMNVLPMFTIEKSEPVMMRIDD